MNVHRLTSWIVGLRNICKIPLRRLYFPHLCNEILYHLNKKEKRCKMSPHDWHRPLGTGASVARINLQYSTNPMLNCRRRTSLPPRNPVREILLFLPCKSFYLWPLQDSNDQKIGKFTDVIFGSCVGLTDGCPLYSHLCELNMR